MNNIIRNILNEKPIVEDDLFHLVRDKDPICPDHYLIFPKHECGSLAELSIDKRAYLNALISSMFSKEFLFFERGNVSFCTSMNAPTYAHGHILNTMYFKKDLLDNLLNRHNFIETDSVLKGLALASNKQEYLLAGEINSRWLMASPFTSPTKRYIRTILVESLSYEVIP